MAEPVRARRLTDQEGQRLLQIVREPRQNMPRSARQLPGEAIQAGSAGLPRRAR